MIVNTGAIDVVIRGIKFESIHIPLATDATTWFYLYPWSTSATGGHYFVSHNGHVMEAGGKQKKIRI